MSQYSMESVDALKTSIAKIGNNVELKFKSKKIIEDLKKCKMELIQETYNDAFNLNENKK